MVTVLISDWLLGTTEVSDWSLGIMEISSCWEQW